MNEKLLMSLHDRLDALEKRVLELENEQGVEDRANRTEEVDFSKKWFVICNDDDGKPTFATRRWFASLETAWKYADTVAPSRDPEIIYSYGQVGYEEHSFGK